MTVTSPQLRVKLLDRWLGRGKDRESTQNTEEVLRQLQEGRAKVRDDTAKVIQLRRSYAKYGKRMAKKK